MDLLNQLQMNDDYELGGCCDLPEEWDYMSNTSQHRYLTQLVKQTKDDYERAKQLRREFLHGSGFVGGELLGYDDEHGGAILGGKRNKKKRKMRDSMIGQVMDNKRTGRRSGLPYCPRGQQRTKEIKYGDCHPKNKPIKKQKKSKNQTKNQAIPRNSVYDYKGRPNYQKFKKILLKHNPDLTQDQISQAFTNWKLTGGNFWDSFKKGFMMPFDAAAKLAPLAPLIL